MKELVARLLDALPMFCRRLVALLLSPKAAVLAQDLESDSALTEALTFVSVAFGISFIAQIPFLPEGDKEVVFALFAVLSALFFALNAALAILAWKLVGGRLAWKKFIVATCYFCGVSTVLFAAVSLIAAGTFKSLDPDGFDQYLSGRIADPVALVASTGFQAFAALLVAAFLVTYIWIFLVWGAYRQLLQLSRRRSAIALLLFFAFTPILYTTQVVLAKIVTPAPPGPVVPQELAGMWETTHPNQKNGIPWEDVIAYQFLAPTPLKPSGTYNMFKRTSSVENKCLSQSLQMETGRIAVRGAHLTLIPQQRRRIARSSCTTESNEVNDKDLTSTEYTFKVDQQAAPWTLCLSDRYGQTCLSPKKPQP